MVSPSPELHRKLENTNNIILAEKSHLITELYDKYPNDYVSLDMHNHISYRKPWINPINYQSHIGSSLQNLEQSQEHLKKIVTTQSDKIIIICVDFGDKPSSISLGTIGYRFFGLTGNTFRNYYSEISSGKYIPEGIILGWYRMPQLYSYYRDDPSTSESDYGMGKYPHNSQRMYEDVLDIINNDQNVTHDTLNSIDTDNDGYINRVVIVHAGGEAAYNAQKEIWAHTWEINPKTIKGKTFQIYAISSEYLSHLSDTQRSGIDVHEYGHVLGLPDLYDYNNRTNGVGSWSTMGFGSWGNNAITPVHFDCWCKKQLGWIDLISNKTGIVTISPIMTSQSSYVYTTSDPKEYFMLENRYKTFFDTYIEGNGLLIWHINENDKYKNPYNYADCHTVTLDQADNRKDLENKVNIGDNGDPYPGSSNNRSFTKTTYPNSLTCENRDTLLSITNISNPDTSNNIMMTVDILSSCPVPIIQTNIN